jgi:hypothetical protein
MRTELVRGDSVDHLIGELASALRTHRGGPLLLVLGLEVVDTDMMRVRAALLEIELTPPPEDT